MVIIVEHLFVATRHNSNNNNNCYSNYLCCFRMLLLSHCYETSMHTCNSCYSSSLLLSLIIMIMSLLTTTSSSSYSSQSSYEQAPRTVQQAHGYDIAGIITKSIKLNKLQYRLNWSNFRHRQVLFVYVEILRSRMAITIDCI